MCGFLQLGLSCIQHQYAIPNTPCILFTSTHTLVNTHYHNTSKKTFIHPPTALPWLKGQIPVACRSGYLHRTATGGQWVDSRQYTLVMFWSSGLVFVQCSLSGETSRWTCWCYIVSSFEVNFAGTLLRAKSSFKMKWTVPLLIPTLSASSGMVIRSFCMTSIYIGQSPRHLNMLRASWNGICSSWCAVLFEMFVPLLKGHQSKWQSLLGNL